MNYGTSAKLIASIVETGLMAILGIACIISECNKQTRTQALQNTIDNAQQEIKRVNSTPFLLK